MKRTSKCQTAVCMVIVGSTAAIVALAAPKDPPKFEAFAVSTGFEGPVHPVDLASHPKARRYETVLREGAVEPPDFAGHYKLVSWGCGTSCQVNALVDLMTGRVYFGPGSNVGTEHRANSALLVINPPQHIPRDATGRQPDGYHLHTYYYRWNETGKRLEPIYSDDPTGFP